MKKFFFVTASLLFSIMLTAQNPKEAGRRFINAFEGDSVVWKSCLELNFEGIENPIMETILYGDTVIDGIVWKIFNEPWSKGLIRTEGAKVLFKPYPGYQTHVISEGVIYDFSLDVGDIFEGKEGVNAGIKVTQIDSVELNDGKKHKKLSFEHDYSCIEGLGNDTREPFYMIHMVWPTMPSISTLMCCHVDGELLYMNPDYSDCDGGKVGNENIITEDHQKARVTYSNNRLHVTIEDSNPFDVKVYNMQGMLVSLHAENYNEIAIPMGNMPQGIYIVCITSGQYTCVHKIIK